MKLNFMEKRKEKEERLRRLKLFSATYSTYKIILNNIYDLDEEIITVKAEISLEYLKKLLSRQNLDAAFLDENENSDIEIFDMEDCIGIRINNITQCRKKYLDSIMYKFFETNSKITDKAIELFSSGKEKEAKKMQRILNSRLENIDTFL